MTESGPPLQPHTFLIGLPWRPPPRRCLEECSRLASLCEGHIAARRANYPLEGRGERPGRQLVLQSGSPLQSWAFVISISSSSLSAGTSKLWVYRAQTEQNTRCPVSVSEPSSPRARDKRWPDDWEEGTQNNRRCLGKRHLCPQDLCCYLCDFLVLVV